MERQPNRPLRQPAPEQRDRGIGDVEAADGPRGFINQGFWGFALALAKLDLLSVYRKVKGWYFWLYFVSLGLFGGCYLFTYCHPFPIFNPLLFISLPDSKVLN